MIINRKFGLKPGINYNRINDFLGPLSFNSCIMTFGQPQMVNLIAGGTQISMDWVK